MKKEDLIKILDESFLGVALEDLKRASDSNTNLAVFILGVCFIDSLAGFSYGKKEINDKQDGVRFKKFVEKYLKKFNKDELWNARSGLLHSYSAKGYNFVNKKQEYHNKINGENKIINDENFLEDLKLAYENFKKDILKDDIVFQNVQIRYKSLGLMKITELK